MSRVSDIKDQLAALQTSATELMGTIDKRSDKLATAEENTKLKEIREGLQAKRKELEEAELLQKELGDLAAQAAPEPGKPADQRAANPNGKPAPHVQPGMAAGQPTFRSVGEQLQAIWLVDNPTVRNGSGKEKAFNMLEEAQKRAGQPSGLNTMNGPEGGYAIEQEFVAEIQKNEVKTGILLEKCKKIPMRTNSIRFLALSDENRQNGSRLGGIVAYWVNEAETVQKSKPKMRVAEMRLNKLMALGFATAELLEDAPALGAIMTDSWSDEFGYMIDEAVLFGPGTDCPLGILDPKYKGTLIIPKEGSQTEVVLAKNLAKMKNAMPQRHWASAFWAVNPEVIPDLELLTITVGTGGQVLMMPPTGLSQLPYSTIYGRPVIPIEQATGAKGVGDIMFLSMDAYLIGQKGEVRQESSIHVRFEYDETAFRAIRRIGGQPIPEVPFTPAKSNTGYKMSPFIALGSRL